jgi:putative Mg2+ transporter-C (MgtC) family protein
MGSLHQQFDATAGYIIVRLIVATVLGGIIGLEREIRHKPAGLRTNMFICMGSAMFTILSNELAKNWNGDHTRIAAQIIAGIGFIGAGAILRERGSITGLTSAATIFVSAGIGMAAGGGLYAAAAFATILIIIALVALGKVEHHFEQKRLRVTYEVIGQTTEAILSELNIILAEENLRLQDVHAAAMDGHSRVVFDVEGLRPGYNGLTVRLHQSSAFSSVQVLDMSGKRHER